MPALMLPSRLLRSLAGASLIALAALPALHAMAIVQSPSTAGTSARPELRVRATDDFSVNGRGDHAAWNAAEWTTMNARQGVTDAYATKFKVLYSRKGLYVLMDGDDKTLTATFTEDNANLWTEDVFEVFLWPDERDSIYFEYEISPLGRELPILVPNFDKQFLGWLPWNYDGERRIQKAVSARGGPQASKAAVEGWRAEFMIPYPLLRPLRSVPPEKNTRWRANFYRIDHDRGKPVQWDWSRVGANFHDFANYGTLLFD